jgi:hypothetical protein
MSFLPRWAIITALLLTGIIVLELKFVTPKAETIVAATGAAVLPLPSSLPARAEERMPTIVARPLFSSSRRPAVSEPSSLPRLAGTMVSPARKRALFAGNSESAPYSLLAEGDQFGNWTVQAIAAGTVTLTGPTGEREMHVGFEDMFGQTRMAALLPQTKPVRTHDRKQQRPPPS